MEPRHSGHIVLSHSLFVLFLPLPVLELVLTSLTCTEVPLFAILTLFHPAFLFLSFVFSAHSHSVFYTNCLPWHPLTSHSVYMPAFVHMGVCLCGCSLMHFMTYWGNKKLLCRDFCGPLIKHPLCDLIADASCHRIQAHLLGPASDCIANLWIIGKREKSERKGRKRICKFISFENSYLFTK